MRLFFHFDYYISISYIPTLYHKTFIPFHFHAESEEYAILASEGVVALVANAKLN